MKKALLSITAALSLLVSSPLTAVAGANEEFDYKGELKDGKYEGVGELSYSGQLVYKGDFKNGEYDGKGTFYYPDRTLEATKVAEPTENVNRIHYEGEFKQGMFHGQGTSYFEIYFPEENSSYKGIQYQGKFRYDQYSGYGTEYDMKGNIINQGYFLAGEAMSYEGNKDQDGLMDGEGTLKNLEGDLMYEGTFKHGELEGKGTLYEPQNSWKYTGEFKDDQFDGTGKVYVNDKLYYEGEFKEGLKEGEGTLYTADEKVLYKGLFKNDRPVEVPFKIHSEIKVDKNVKATYQITVLLNDKTKNEVAESTLSEMKKQLEKIYGAAKETSVDGNKGFIVTGKINEIEEGIKDPLTGFTVQFTKTKELFTNKYVSFINPSDSYDKNIVDFSISYSLSGELKEISSSSPITKQGQDAKVDYDQNAQEIVGVQFEQFNVLNTVIFALFLVVLVGGIIYFKKTGKKKEKQLAAK